MKIEAEQVRAGMVFEHLPTGKRVTTIRLYSERPETIACRPHAWECNPGGVLVEAGPEFAFLGCDPALAARADCELFGIAEGFDAAAHGFARTREGGAVDLRQECPAGAVYALIGGHGPRYTTGAAVAFTEKMGFVGLDASVASPEDLRRLCCGVPNEREGHTLKHITETGKRDVCCTLAIGDHAEHEDISAGVKWPANRIVAGAGLTGGGDLRPHLGAPVKDGSGDFAVSAGLSFTGPAKLTFGTPLSSVVGGPHEKLQRFVEREIAVALLGSGAVARPRDPEASSRSGWVHYLPTGPVFVEDGAVAGPAVLLPKADPSAAPLPGFYIASRRYDCTVHAPTRRGGDLQIDLDVPMHTDAVREHLAEMRAHLEAGRECQLRAGNSTVVGYAVRWTREADPQRRGVEKFTVWFRPSNEQPAPAPAAPKVSPTAARDAAVAKAVADVPACCSAAGWRNVVHVLAADAHELLRTLDSRDVAQFLTDARPLCAAYERERRAGYGREQAAKRSGAAAKGLRLLAAYEAGR